jgi:CheY-like chemotaxis protein
MGQLDPHSKRVLVVDDEKDVQGLVCNVLQDQGYIVDSAGDGQEALEKIQATSPDLVILDLMMPIMDGWQVLAKLERIPPPKVVILSAFSDKTRALQAGASDCLPKPFRIGELIGTCARVLQG